MNVENLYKDIGNAYVLTKSSEIRIIMSDFNAKMGMSQSEDVFGNYHRLVLREVIVLYNCAKRKSWW